MIMGGGGREGDEGRGEEQEERGIEKKKKEGETVI